MNNLPDKPRFEGAQLIVETRDTPASYDARFLISTLLVYVAKGDGDISELESNKMIDMLSSKLNIRSGEALEQLSAAIMALSNDEDLVATLRGVSEGLSETEKDEVLQMMFELMAVDSYMDPGERDSILLAGQILGLSQDAVYAQLRSVSFDS